MTVPNTYLRRKIVNALGEGPSTSAALALKIDAEHHSILPALRALVNQGLLKKAIPRDRIPVWRLA